MSAAAHGRGTLGVMNDTVEIAFDLTAEEARVLGCLIEKEATTPAAYPLTLNSLRLACNQSTSREPVVDYSDHDIEQALRTLRERGLTRNVHSTSNRAMKYRHVVPEALGLDVDEVAIIGVLILRGPQTIGELKSRTERIHAFADLAEVERVARRPGLCPPSARRRTRPGGRAEGVTVGPPPVGCNRTRSSISAGCRQTAGIRSGRALPGRCTSHRLCHFIP